MSTIESQSGAVDQYRRTRTGPLDIPGVQGSLDTPGLAVSPPASSGAQTADRLIQAFSSLGGFSAQVAHFQQQEAAQEEHRQRLARQHQADVDTADRGHSNIDAASDMPSLVSRIERGELAPGADEDVRAFVERITTDGTDGMSEAYIDQRRKALSDNVSAALQRRHDALTNAARSSNAGLAVQSIDGATDAADFDKAVKSFRTFMPDTSEDVAAAEVGKRWLENAVTTARIDPEKGAKILAAARSKLGSSLQTEQIKAQADFETLLLQHDQRTFARLQDDVGKMLEHGASFPAVMEFIKQQGEKLNIDVHQLTRQVDTEHQVLHNRRETDAAAAVRTDEKAKKDAEEKLNQDFYDALIANDPKKAEQIARERRAEARSSHVFGLIEQVRSFRDRQARESRENLKAEERSTFEQTVRTQALAMATAGNLHLVGDARKTLPDGTEVHMTRSEIMEQAMNARFQQIDALNPDDKEKAKREMVKAAAENAYYPSGWKNLIEGAAAKTSVTAITEAKDGKLSPDATKGYEFFKQLTAQAPGLLDSMSLNTRTRKLFTAAMELEKIPAVGSDPMTALSNAAAVVDRPDGPLDHLKFSALANELDIATQSDREIARDAAPIAEILVRLGKTPEEAVAQAVKQVKANRIVINGWSSRLGNVPEDLRYRFADVAQDKIDAYAKAELANTGIDPSDLAFSYDSNADRWQIVMQDTGLLAPTNNPAGVVFFTPELIRASTQKNEQLAKEKYLQRQRERDRAFDRAFPTNFTDRMDMEMQ